LSGKRFRPSTHPTTTIILVLEAVSSILLKIFAGNFSET
jgi:hypothetical protein